MKKIVFILAIICILVSTLVFCTNIFNADQQKYDKAKDLIASGDYSAAYELLLEIKDYSDVEKELSKFRYVILSGSETHTDYELNETTYYFNIEYNENGLPLCDTTTYSDGTKDIYSYTYDENGLLIKEDCEFCEGDNANGVFTYDNNGRLIKHVYTNPDGEEITREYSYDENGNLIKDTYSYTYTMVQEYTYDANGVLTKMVTTNTYDTGYSQISTTVYSYDSNGKLIKKYRNSDSEIDSIEYTYDENGRLIKEVDTHFYVADGVPYYEQAESCEYNYDTNGNIIKKSINMSYNQYEITEYTYDQNNNIIGLILSGTGDYRVVSNLVYGLVYIPYDTVSDSVPFWEIDVYWNR